MNTLLSVNNLSTKFKTARGTAHAVRYVNFQIKSGEVMGLVGESGSGKSVTARSIMRLVERSKGFIEGEILVDGQNITAKTEKEMSNIRGNLMSMIFQNPMTALNPLFTVGEQIAEVYRYHKKASRKEAKIATIELMNKIGIPAAEKRYAQYPHEFSGGMLQRIMIAIALACNPKLLIADEPTTALDVTIQAQILRLLSSLQKEFDMGILIITHDLGVVAEICDRVSVMYAGEIVESGNVEDILKNPMHPYTFGLIQSIPRLGSAQKKLSSIEGSPPDLHKVIEGCPFLDRCEFKLEKCKVTSPKLNEISDGHLVSCHNIEAVVKRRESIEQEYAY